MTWRIQHENGAEEYADVRKMKGLMKMFTEGSQHKVKDSVDIIRWLERDNASIENNRNVYDRRADDMKGNIENTVLD